MTIISVKKQFNRKIKVYGFVNYFNIYYFIVNLLFRIVLIFCEINNIFSYS